MITIHCGLPKTGTTSIQTGLRLASDTSKRTIIVPTEHDKYSEGWWMQCLTRMARTRDGILSHELLLFENSGGELISRKRVEMLQHCLAGSPFQIIVYLRPQIDWLASVYLHYVAAGSLEGPEAFWERMAPQSSLVWSELLRLLREESGAVKVVTRAFGPSRDLVQDFFNLCDLGNPPRVGRSPIRENVSIKAVQAPIMLAINRQTSRQLAEQIKLRQVFQQVLSREAPGGFSPFPESIQREISAKYMEDWTIVSDSLKIQGDAEAKAFMSESVIWSAIPIPFASKFHVDAPVEHEAIRTIGQLALMLYMGNPTRIARIRAKFVNDPRGIFSSLQRSARRWKATRYTKLDP